MRLRTCCLPSCALVAVRRILYCTVHHGTGRVVDMVPISHPVSQVAHLRQALRPAYQGNVWIWNWIHVAVGWAVSVIG